MSYEMAVTVFWIFVFVMSICGYLGLRMVLADISRKTNEKRIKDIEDRLDKLEHENTKI